MIVPQFVTSFNWVKVQTDYCVACGVFKFAKGKSSCVVYGRLVNGGQHHYIAFEQPHKPLPTNKK